MTTTPAPLPLYITCDECEYAYLWPDTIECPNPACFPNCAEYVKAVNAWNAGLARMISEYRSRPGIYYSTRAIRDIYTREHPFPTVTIPKQTEG